AWARTYLVKAVLLKSTGKGKFQVTPRGLNVLHSKPPAITIKFLDQFPEFVAFHHGPPVVEKIVEGNNGAGVPQTPQETLDVIYLQAKRWDAAVGSPTVANFAGSLEANKANKGVLLTTSTFSQPAREFVAKVSKTIILIDGQQLAQLMVDYGVGVTEVANYT